MAEPKVSVVLKVKDQATRKLRGFRNSLRRLGAEAKAILSNRLLQGVGFASLAVGLKKATDAADAFIASQIKLAGIAKITGTELEFLQSVAARAEQTFKLSKVQANEFASEIAKLTGAAGELGLTADALDAFLNIGAARGLDAAATLQAVKQAVLGIDEGTDKLFDANPSVLYERYAKSIDTTAGKLTDMQKKQAIVNAALTDAAKVGGAYNDFLATAAGQQAQLNVELENMAIRIGQAMEPVRRAFIPALAFAAEKIQQFVGGIQLLAVEAGFLFHSIGAELQLLASTIIRTLGELVSKADPLLKRLGLGEVGATLVANANDLQTQAIQRLADLADALTAAQLEIVNQGSTGIVAATPTGGSVTTAPGAAAGGGPSDTGGGGGLPGIGESGDALGIGTLEAIGAAVDEVTGKASGMQDAFVQAFTASTAGAKGFGDALGKATIGAVKGTSRVLGREQFAKAAAKFAEGLWPPNPLAIASGLKHLGAGAAFMALAGGGGGGRAGGGVGGGLSPRTLGGGGVGGINPGGSVTIRMPRNALAMTGDPFFQDWLAEALRKAGARDVTIEQGALA